MRVRTIVPLLAMMATGFPLAISAQTAPQPAAAQGCSNEQVSAVIDDTGARLRQLNADSQPRLRARLRELAQKRGWTDAELQTQGLTVLQDERTTVLDGQAGQLLMRLDQLGDEGRAQGSACKRLEDARIAAAQLVEVTNERSTHVLARIDAALRPAAPAVAIAPPVAALPKTEARPARAAPPPPVQTEVTAQARPKAPPAPSPPASSWGAETVREAQPSPTAMAELPRPLDPGELGFTPDDIRAAGRGIFGTISAELASVIDFAFTNYGRPSGYVIGGEGGGAFLAGLRYGEGTLVTKLAGERKVFWQGPSVGYDFGLAGSQVMFLVYNVTDVEQLYSRFAGVDGSAYLVGGVGITFLKKGPIVLAPIRTGLGLRIGANIGYLKFTPTLSLNPF